MIAIGFAYLRERLPWRLWGPVILLLTFAAAWATNARTPGVWCQAVVLMSLLVVQFRLWDDLRDRDRDRETHPNRVLVRTDPRPFQRFVCALAAAGLAVAWGMGGERPLLALSGLNLVFAALYAWIRPALNKTLWRFPVLLAKYPAFVAIVAVAIGRPAAGRMTIAALLVYGGAQIFEAVHSSPTLATRFHPDKSESHRPSS